MDSNAATDNVETVTLPAVTITGDGPDDWTVILGDGSYYVGMNMSPAQLREQAAAFLAVARHLEAIEATLRQPSDRIVLR